MFCETFYEIHSILCKATTSLPCPAIPNLIKWKIPTKNQPFGCWTLLRRVVKYNLKLSYLFLFIQNETLFSGKS